MTLKLIVPCPHCGSSDIRLVPYAQVTGLVLSGITGAVLAARNAGSRHPLILLLGAIGGAAAWGIQGSDVGHHVDTTVLRRYQCGGCGEGFGL